MNSKIIEIIETFSRVRVLVVGDVMLDRYWWGSVERISPEAPVPVVQLDRESLLAGGAANVAANIKGLGANVALVGLVGTDSEGTLLAKALVENGISADFLVPTEGRPTTVKTRIVAHQQQIARIDQETRRSISAADESRVLRVLNTLMRESDVVVVSDYAKGLLTDNLLARLISDAKSIGKRVLVDPKGRDYWKYRHAGLLTPNRKEALEASGCENVRAAGTYLLSELALEAVLVTEGEDGMTIFEPTRGETHLPALARHVYDVTGAGDTVIATLAVALAAGADLRTAAEIANLAAGFVVEEVGTTVITIEKLKRVTEGL